MTKILLGIAIGYICSDMIDELLGKSINEEKVEKAVNEEKVEEAPTYRPMPPRETS